MKRVYISGKIGGLPDGNKPKFEAAENLLRENGYDVVNPHKIHPPNCHHYTWADYMREDIIELMQCQLIAVLNDWQDSPGAFIEVKLALVLGMPMICAHTLQQLEYHEQVPGKRMPNKYILKEVKRELEMRRSVYPQWVTMGRISKQDADHRIEVLEQVFQDYKDLKHIGATTAQPIQSHQQGNLF